MKKIISASVFFVFVLASCVTYLPTEGDGTKIYKISPIFDENRDYVVLGEVVYSGKNGTRGFLDKASEMYPDAEAVVDCYVDMVDSGYFLWFRRGVVPYYRGFAVKSLSLGGVNAH